MALLLNVFTNQLIVFLKNIFFAAYFYMDENIVKKKKDRKN